jgi:RND family efflux transporter MFP subunit
MNDLDQQALLKGPPPRPLLPGPDRDTGPLPSAPGPRRAVGRRALGLGMLVLFAGSLALGAWRHYGQHRQVMDTAEQQANFVPSVHLEAVAQRLGRLHVTLPATTLGFEEANIYARASGYVLKRYVDIGDHVKAGQLLAEITAPEVEDQITQYQNSLQQAQETHGQNQAQQSLAQVTLGRDSTLVKQGWVTLQQGDTDRYTYQAQQHATQAAHYSSAATQAQLEYYSQQKLYQKVVAPFDGVITQRNIDVGSLITADSASGTSMFSMTHSDVIRVWVYVPQDNAFGVKPGIEAVIRVPAMPNPTFATRP